MKIQLKTLAAVAALFFRFNSAPALLADRTYEPLELMMAQHPCA